MVYMCITIQCYFILLLYYILEANIVLFTLLHLYGSFIWQSSMDMWTCRFHLALKLLPQMLQPKWFLSSMDFHVNLKRLFFLVKHFPQMLQPNVFSPVWTLMWSLRFPYLVKLFPQTLQPNRVFKPDALISFLSSTLASVTDGSEALSSVSGWRWLSGSRFLAGCDPPQSSPSDSVSICSAELLAGGSAFLDSSVWL